MTKLIPGWVMRRYLKLRSEFDSKNFTFKEAQTVLKDDGRIINLFLSKLKESGWLNVSQHPEDKRKKLYQLKPLEEAFNEIEKKVIKGVQV